MRDALYGTVCFAGIVSNEWIIPDFYPISYIPSGVRLTGYEGDASNLPQPVLQRFLHAIENGKLSLPISRVYELQQIQEAHADMENNRARLEKMSCAFGMNSEEKRR